MTSQLVGGSLAPRTGIVLTAVPPRRSRQAVDVDAGGVGRGGRAVEGAGQPAHTSEACRLGRVMSDGESPVSPPPSQINGAFLAASRVWRA